MDQLASKALPLAVYPLGLVALLLLAAVVFSLLGKVRLTRALIVLPLVILMVASAPAFSNWLVGTLEERYPAVSFDQALEADLIIVLGGLAGTSANGAPDFTDAIDRALAAAGLYKADKASAILIAGGNQPWSGSPRPEAEIIADLLVELGIPREALVIEGESRNTRENAVNAAPLVAEEGWQDVILVTSAWHMPRALPVFGAVGIDAMPFVTDARQQPVNGNVLDYLPDVGALTTTTLVVKEWIGQLVYRMRGWM